MIDSDFWKNKTVLITGHTGFKGSWLAFWLHQMGANVIGYALAPITSPNLFDSLRLDQMVTSIQGDIRDFEALRVPFETYNPDIVIHMAAQPLVRYSYEHPVETFEVNVMGTVNVLEAARKYSPQVVLIVTTDKCYQNQEWVWGYRENEPLGGKDPYSSSKGCAELVTEAYRSSYFAPGNYESHKVAIASARAGNVIGGGDWAKDRIIPDLIRGFEKKEAVLIRNPDSIRPWQHVLEPLSGYLLLSQKLWLEGSVYSGAWNFGPHDLDAKPVSWIADRLTSFWGEDAKWIYDQSNHPHEANYLKLDWSKAYAHLGWSPTWNLEETLKYTTHWYKTCKLEDHLLIRHLISTDIREFTKG